MSGTGNLIDTPFPIAVSNGGTAASSFTPYAVLCGGTTSTGALQSIASVGISGEVLTSNGSALPSFQTSAGLSIQTVASYMTTQSYLSAPTGWTDSGLSIAITPTASTSSILILGCLYGSAFSSTRSIIMSCRLVRGSTPIAVNTDAATVNATTITNVSELSTQVSGFPNNIFYIDAPATTSAITYKIQVYASISSVISAGDVLINTVYTSPPGAVGGVSSIIAIELAG